MQTTPVTPAAIAASTWAVPPLARAADGSLSRQENARIIRHIEQGGISTLLYGGNAILYHVPLSEYAAVLELIVTLAAEESLVIPSVGPAFGTMMDQAALLEEHAFPTVMVLPQRDVATSTGMATAIRQFVERFGKPVVVYLKYDEQMAVGDVARLAADGLVSAVKYAVIRDDPANDDYLRRLVDAIDPKQMLSGLGDQPAIVHLRDYGLGSFTTGCGCVAPRITAALLEAIQAEDWERAEELRAMFVPLETLRDAWGPIPVLHVAVREARIAETGPILPLLSEPAPDRIEAIAGAALALAAMNSSL